MAQKSPKTLPTAIDSIQEITMRIKRTQQRLYMIGLLVFIGTTSFLFFKRYQRQQNDSAQNEMFQAVYYFEEEAFDKALNGDGICAGLLDIAKEYRFTQAANLAHFYIGVSYMRQKDHARAIQHLTRFRSKDLLVQARAWALVGDAYTEEKKYQSAVSFYMKAADYNPNKIFTPIYLTKAALAYEAIENFRAALGCYERIVQKFADAAQYKEALKHVARLKAINTQGQQPPSQSTTP
jgi:tetratricopeptide (TPR) repeat protein